MGSMRYFERLLSDYDVDPILDEIYRQHSAWHLMTGRQARARVQADTQSIPLRGLRRSKIMGRRRRDVHESRPTSLSTRFPATVAALDELAGRLDGALGRAKLALLPPGMQVRPHSDRGEYYRVRNRYHLVLSSTGGSELTAGDERVHMQAAELWWFDNKAIHSARNDSDTARIHMIFDLLPAGAVPYDASAEDDIDGNPAELLPAIRAARGRSAREQLADAARLYKAICRNPRSWQQVLREHELEEAATRRPLRVLSSLLWPELDGSRRRRRESALAWSLAQLDLDMLSLDAIDRGIKQAGGFRTIHEQWHSDREAMLYG